MMCCACSTSAACSRSQLNLTPAYLAEIIKLVDAGTINTSTGKSLLEKVEEAGTVAGGNCRGRRAGAKSAMTLPSAPSARKCWQKARRKWQLTRRAK